MMPPKKRVDPVGVIALLILFALAAWLFFGSAVLTWPIPPG